MLFGPRDDQLDRLGIVYITTWAQPHLLLEVILQVRRNTPLIEVAVSINFEVFDLLLICHCIEKHPQCIVKWPFYTPHPHSFKV